MDSDHVLIVALVALVILLAALLFYRLRQERRLRALVDDLPLEDFAELARLNSQEGSLVEVARKVSDLLIGKFGCDRLLFLRKKRGFLEVNFRHNLSDLDRQQFRIRFDGRIDSALRTAYLPRPVHELEQVWPEESLAEMRRRSLDLFFPVYWRQNLYGVYFMPAAPAVRAKALNLLVAGLAQSLSAAYHIKWHESRLEMRARREEAESTHRNTAADLDRQSFPVLRLVRHRDAESLMPHLFTALRNLTNLEGLVCIAVRSDSEAAPLVFARGLESRFDVPALEQVRSLISVLGGGCRRLSELGSSSGGSAVVTDLRRLGLEQIASCRLSESRSGLIAWSSRRPVEDVLAQIKLFEENAVELVSNAEEFRRVEELSYTDGLTGLANRRYFAKRLDEEISRAGRYGRKLGLIIFDLDRLKATNDTYGHLAGDSVLRLLGAILSRSIRTIDIVARYGGDEFCVIMPESDREICLKFMNRLQNEIAEASFEFEGIDMPLHRTVSIGGAVFPDNAASAHELIHAADMALLAAKSSGRNCAVISDLSPVAGA